MRRARVVSTDPVSDYQLFLYADRRWNLEHGEQVRWLTRDHASDLRLPGNDFWLANAGLDVVNFCAQAFAAVWDRAAYPANEIFG